jgi:hypothetical protein
MKSEPRHISVLLNDFLIDLRKRQNKRLFGGASLNTSLDWQSRATINNKKVKL